MKSYATYLAKRLFQFLLVVFIGINIAFFVTHLTPIDPVEESISAATAFGATSPEAIDMLRESLTELDTALVIEVDRTDFLDDPVELGRRPALPVA